MESQLETRPTSPDPSARANTPIEQQFLALIERGKTTAIPSATIFPLYRQLEPVSIEFMLGTWHGSLFNGQPTQGWWGKNMISPDHVQPLLFQREDGSVYSNEVWGLAKLTEGEVYGLGKTGMLVYNDKPLQDYFRKLNDDTMIGLTLAASIGATEDFYFQLTRDRVTKVGG